MLFGRVRPSPELRAISSTGARLEFSSWEEGKNQAQGSFVCCLAIVLGGLEDFLDLCNLIAFLGYSLELVILVNVPRVPLSLHRFRFLLFLGSPFGL